MNTPFINNIVNNCVRQMAAYVENEINSAVQAKIGGYYSLEDIATRCTLTPYHYHLPRTLVIDGAPVLEIFPPVAKLDGVKISYTQSVRRLYES